MQGGCSYIVMDYVRGQSLKQAIKLHGQLPLPVVRAAVHNMLSCLHAVHRAGYVHGDLHSGNVLVTDLKRGRLKIVDFQHASRKGACGTAPAVPRLGKVAPKLAPETATGPLTDRTDLYGVGYMCAAMLLGRDPRPGEIALLAQRNPASSPHSSPSVWEVLATATDPSPARRFRSAREMLAALRRARWTLP